LSVVQKRIWEGRTAKRPLPVCLSERRPSTYSRVRAIADATPAMLYDATATMVLMDIAEAWLRVDGRELVVMRGACRQKRDARCEDEAEFDLFHQPTTPQISHITTWFLRIMTLRRLSLFPSVTSSSSHLHGEHDSATPPAAVSPPQNSTPLQ
jgi:hypothetical protein